MDSRQVDRLVAALLTVADVIGEPTLNSDEQSSVEAVKAKYEWWMQLQKERGIQ